MLGNFNQEPQRKLRSLPCCWPVEYQFLLVDYNYSNKSLFKDAHQVAYQSNTNFCWLAIIIVIRVYLKVRNKWLRLLETMGGRGASMTGAPAQQAASAEAQSSNQQQPGGSQPGNSSRCRGRGGFQNRGGNTRGGRGGSRVVPRPVIPPASVSTPSKFNCGTGSASVSSKWFKSGPSFYFCLRR